MSADKGKTAGIKQAPDRPGFTPGSQPGMRRPGGPAGGPGGGPAAMIPGEKPNNFSRTAKRSCGHEALPSGELIALIFAVGSTVFAIIGPKILGRATTRCLKALSPRHEPVGSRHRL